MSIQPTGRRSVDFEPATADSGAAAETSATDGARATRIPTSTRPIGPQGTLPEPAKWGGAGSIEQDLEYLMDKGELVDAREMLRGALSVANRMSILPDPESDRMRTALNHTLESLARQKKLDNLIVGLGAANSEAPEPMHSQPVTEMLDRFVRTFASAGAKKAFDEESLLARNPTSTVLTRDVTEGVNLGVDELTSMHMRRLNDLFQPRAGIDIPTDMPPEGLARYMKEKGETLAKTVHALERKGTLDDAIEAMKRETDRFVSEHPNVRYYPPEVELRKLITDHCPPETLAAWDKAANTTRDNPAEIAKRITESLGRSSDAEVSKLAASLLSASPAHRNEVVKQLGQDGKLDDLIRACDRALSESMSALQRKHPGIRAMIHPIPHALGAKIDENGTREVKEMWSKAMRSTEKTSGTEMASDITAALKGGEDHEVAFTADALQYAARRSTLVSTARPEAIADLNSAVTALDRRDKLDDLAKTLKRFDADHPPQGPTAPSRFDAFDSAVKSFGSAAAKRAWRDATNP